MFCGLRGLHLWGLGWLLCGVRHLPRGRNFIDRERSSKGAVKVAALNFAIHHAKRQCERPDEMVSAEETSMLEWKDG